MVNSKGDLPVHPLFAEPVERIYSGQIRQGRPGTLTPEVYSVYRGSGSGAAFLDPMVETVYESDAYRREVNPDATVSTYFSLHDSMARLHFTALSGLLARDAVVADIGCGGGAVLDLAHGHTATTIAVEPFEGFHASLRSRQHQPFGSLEQACASWMGKIDNVWSLHVIEHVRDPVAFMRDIAVVLRQGGRGLVLTPNLDDILLSTCAPAYAPFWFRKVHLWYFSGHALAKVVESAGLRVTRVRYVHEYGFSNYLHWIASGQPKGATPWPGVTPEMDADWTRQMERQGQASAVAVEFEKP